MKITNSYLLIIFCTGLILTSCSESTNEGKQTKKTAAETNVDLMKIDAAAPETEIALNATGNSMDEMAYEPKELTVKTGTTVVLNFNNLSTDGAMLHNFVLITDGNADKVGVFGVQAGAENDFVPSMKEVLVHTKMLQPGEKIQLKFRAPKPGKYMYICTYPGHYSIMQGTFIVSE